jgi:hypothetical protein
LALVGLKDSLHLHPRAVHVVPGSKDGAKLVRLQAALRHNALQLINALQDASSKPKKQQISFGLN